MVEITNETLEINNIFLKLKKLVINNPLTNRKLILKYLKKERGVYIFQSSDKLNIYIGHSINLYSRINNYYMDSILKTKARRVLSYFNKYGFTNIILIVYILEENNDFDNLILLEQYFIDLIKPNLNVDLIARGTGYHYPMSEENKLKLRKERGKTIYIYSLELGKLIYIFDSKTNLMDQIKIHNSTLKDSINLGIIYLNNFKFSVEPINIFKHNLNDLLNIKDLILLIKKYREIYKITHPYSKKILAENIKNKRLNKEFASLNLLTKYLRGDKATIRKYLKNSSNNIYYRGQ